MDAFTLFAGFTCGLDGVSLFLWRVGEIAAPVAVIVGSVFLAKRYKSKIAKIMTIVLGVVAAFVVFAGWIMTQLGCKGIIEILTK